LNSHPASLLLIEPDAVLRQGLPLLLGSHAAYRIAAAVASAREALSCIESLHPAACITELDLQPESAQRLIETLRTRWAAMPVLILADDPAGPRLLEAMRAGASACVLKDSGAGELFEALGAALAGRRFLCAALHEHLMSRFEAATVADTGAVHLITRREREVLTRVALGRSNKLSARELGLSVKTVEKHRSNLMRKLNLHNTAAVTMFALRHGLLNQAETGSGSSTECMSTRSS
jgi:DNA-binding NarL/FixJ family response regulator